MISILIDMLLIFYKNIKHWMTKHQNKIVHKNDDFIIVDKDFDLKINSNDKSEYTIETFLKSKYPLLVNPSLKHNFYFVHRLDYATSGIVCVAITKTASQLISAAFAKRETKKYYIAILRGIVAGELVNVDIPIGEDTRYPKIQKMCTAESSFCSEPRSARTVMIVLAYGLINNYPCTKVLIRCVTGRRHQIRVHCNHLGHTIVGDYTYSNKKDLQPDRMYLNAIRLIFPYQKDIYDFHLEDSFSKKWICYKIINWNSQYAYDKLDNYIRDI